MVDPLPTSGYRAYASLPPASLFNFFTSQNPAPVSPPVRPFSLAYPFNIPPQAYHQALNIAWPISIALIYATTVSYLNKVNARRHYKPWKFSRTGAFFLLVVTHNILLAIYSAWTFLGMLTAIRRAWPSWRESGSAGIADALCKIHGPRGLGSAATYSGKNGAWNISNLQMNLAGGLPDTTDVGRIWNEGLAYYGWIFYLSKFYEVVDTAIILTKGKKSSLLQTYHHTGAMFAMWAGIRYMSPPIWLFTCINSFIHTWMYSYYALVAFGVRINPMVKRTLTGAQIFQIVSGATYAFLHLFVSYDTALFSPFRIANGLSTALPGAFETVSAAVTKTAAGEFRNILKKAALRAAGQEGLAANVRNADGQIFGAEAIHAADAARAQQELVYRITDRRVHCLDTSGEAFAIILNLLYLVPLAYLFISFFARYFDSKPSSGSKGDLQHTRDSATRAAKDLAGQIADAINDHQGGATQAPPGFEDDLRNAGANAKSSLADLKSKAAIKSEEISEKVKEDLEKLGTKSKEQGKKAKQQAATSSKAFANGTSSSLKTEDAKTSYHGEGAGENVKVEGADRLGKPTGSEDVGNAKAYEVNPDKLLSKEEKKAEKKMQKST